MRCERVNGFVIADRIYCADGDDTVLRSGFECAEIYGVWNRLHAWRLGGVCESLPLACGGADE